MNHIWTVFCRDVLEDKNSDVPSLISVTERIAFGGEIPDDRPFDLPFPFPFHIVSSWWRTPSEDTPNHTVRVRFLAPDETELHSIEYEIEFGDGNRFRSFGRIASLPYSENGIYRFEILYKIENEWFSATSIPLEIVHVHSEPEEESEPTG